MLTQRSAPPNTSIYNQKIEPHGYQYLTTRDGTKLAIDVHPPQDVLKILTGLVPNPSEGGRRRHANCRNSPNCRSANWKKS